jgi:raffinose synthase
MAEYPQYFSPGNTNLPMTNRYRESGNGRYNIFRPETALEFYRGYHGYLASQGVDMVKVDNQSSLAGMIYGLGPLPDVAARYINGLETSAAEHFGRGRVLNCMSMVPECLYAYRDNPITRTSTDYFPDSSSSWGPHLVLNAYNSLAWGNLIRPDWDMFLSAHEWAGYHAAARAISGGPVYISDPPGKHDTELVARVALPDGRVLRPQGAAVPTSDILFRDPQREPVLLKLANFNRAGGLILAAFHTNYTNNRPITDSLSLALNSRVDPGSGYAVIESGSMAPILRKPDESWKLTVGEGEYRIFTAAPVNRGVAVLGRAGMFNMGGAVLSAGWTSDGAFASELCCGGKILFYCEQEPSSVELHDSGSMEFAYDQNSRLLSVALPDGESRTLLLHF